MLLRSAQLLLFCKKEWAVRFRYNGGPTLFSVHAFDSTLFSPSNLLLGWKALTINTSSSRRRTEMSEIRCVVCKEHKDETEYNWRNKKLGIRKNYCRLCDRKIKKEYYQRNRSKVIQENVERHNNNRDRFNEWKSTLSCRRCGEADIACLDFHHIDPTQKDLSIAELLSNNSFKKIAEELKKCVCICRNCHGKIHYYGLTVEYAGEVFMDTRESSKLE